MDSDITEEEGSHLDGEERVKGKILKEQGVPRTI